MLWSRPCADLVIFACQQGWSGCGPFWRSGRNQTNYVACWVSVNGHAAQATARFTDKCAPCSGEQEFSKLAHRSHHSSIQHNVCTILKRKLDVQHSIFGVLVRTCVFGFHKSASRASHSPNYSNTSTAPRREPKHNKHNKFHTKLIQHNLLWWFDILAP